MKLAHYTALEILHELVPRINNKKEKSSCFRLHDARGMNDPEEGKRLLREINGLGNFYEETEQEPNSHTFIASFVKEKGGSVEEGQNALLMWITYGKNARGAKLVFPAQGSLIDYDINTVQPKLLSIKNASSTEKGHVNISTSPLPMTVYKVKYGRPERENREGISEILESLDSTDPTIRKCVRHIMDEVRFLYKDKPYKFEKEYRIVWTVSNMDPRVKVNKENNNLYIETENNDFLFKWKKSTIWIGTAVHRKELVRDVVKVNLRDRGYKDCNVKESDIEYIPSSK